jgi:hypothetical protein
MVPAKHPIPPATANFTEKIILFAEFLYCTICALLEIRFGIHIRITASLASKKIAKTGIVTNGLPAPVAPFKIPPIAKAQNKIKIELISKELYSK